MHVINTHNVCAELAICQLVCIMSTRVCKDELADSLGGMHSVLFEDSMARVTLQSHHKLYNNGNLKCSPVCHKTSNQYLDPPG